MIPSPGPGPNQASITSPGWEGAGAGTDGAHAEPTWHGMPDGPHDDTDTDPGATSTGAAQNRVTSGPSRHPAKVVCSARLRGASPGPTVPGRVLADDSASDKNKECGTPGCQLPNWHVGICTPHAVRGSRKRNVPGWLKKAPSGDSDFAIGVGADADAKQCRRQERAQDHKVAQSRKHAMAAASTPTSPSPLESLDVHDEVIRGGHDLPQLNPAGGSRFHGGGIDSTGDLSQLRGPGAQYGPSHYEGLALHMSSKNTTGCARQTSNRESTARLAHRTTHSPATATLRAPVIPR